MPKAKLKSKTTSNRPAQRRLRVQRVVSLAPSECRNDTDCCKIRTTCKDIKGWWMMTDGWRVTICQQRNGEAAKQQITMPTALLKQFMAWFQKPQKIVRNPMRG